MEYLYALFFFIFFNFLFNKNLNADEVHFADSHGPITVMGDHIHKKKMKLCFLYVLVKC